MDWWWAGPRDSWISPIGEWSHEWIGDELYGISPIGEWYHEWIGDELYGISPIGEWSHEWVGDELDHGLGSEHEACLHILLQQLIVLPVGQYIWINS